MVKCSLRSSGFAALLAVASLGFLASGAQASVLALNPCNTVGCDSGSVTIAAGASAGTLSIGTTGLNGFAQFFGANGTWLLGAFGPATTTTEVGGQFFNFGAGVTSTFSYTDSAADHLVGTITWAAIKDGSNIPQLFGTLNITTLTGSALFTSNFASLVAAVDFTLNTPCHPDQIAGGTCSIGGVPATTMAGSLSSGETIPTTVPLPGALVLFGSGLIGLAALGRRKRKQLESAAA